MEYEVINIWNKRTPNESEWTNKRTSEKSRAHFVIINNAKTSAKEVRLHAKIVMRSTRTEIKRKRRRWWRWWRRMKRKQCRIVSTGHRVKVLALLDCNVNKLWVNGIEHIQRIAGSKTLLNWEWWREGNGTVDKNDNKKCTRRFAYKLLRTLNVWYSRRAIMWFFPAFFFVCAICASALTVSVSPVEWFFLVCRFGSVVCFNLHEFDSYEYYYVSVYYSPVCAALCSTEY